MVYEHEVQPGGLQYVGLGDDALHDAAAVEDYEARGYGCLELNALHQVVRGDRLEATLAYLQGRGGDPHENRGRGRIKWGDDDAHALLPRGVEHALLHVEAAGYDEEPHPLFNGPLLDIDPVANDYRAFARVFLPEDIEERLLRHGAYVDGKRKLPASERAVLDLRAECLADIFKGSRHLDRMLCLEGALRDLHQGEDAFGPSLRVEDRHEPYLLLPHELEDLVKRGLFIDGNDARGHDVLCPRVDVGDVPGRLDIESVQYELGLGIQVACPGRDKMAASERAFEL